MNRESSLTEVAQAPGSGIPNLTRRFATARRSRASADALLVAFCDDCAKSLGVQPATVAMLLSELPATHQNLLGSHAWWSILVDTVAMAAGISIDPDRPYFAPSVH